MSIVGPHVRRNGVSRVPSTPWSRSAGLKVLIPGYAQWSWRQRERAAILLGSYLVALGVGGFAWGTRTGLAILIFAFGTHVVSVVDVIRQGAFPAFGRWTPLLSVSGGLAVGIYSPALGLAALMAWPVLDGGPDHEGFLVNCLSYRTAAPAAGERVLARISPFGTLRIGTVVAGPGQELAWADNQLRLDGVRNWEGAPLHSTRPPDSLVFRVPRGHVLIKPESDSASSQNSGGLVLVAQSQVAGRAYARLYPLLQRRILR